MNLFSRVWLGVVLLASLAACEASHQLGSDCPDGVCPRALGRTEPICLVRESRLLIAFENEEEDWQEPVPDFFLTVPVEPEDFGVHRMFWFLRADFRLPNGSEPQACEDAPYLEEPDPESLQVPALQQVLEAGDDRVCLVKRAVFGPGGEVESEGWYFAETSQSGLRRIVRFTDGVPHPPARVQLGFMRSAAQTLTRAGELIETDPNVCALPEDSADYDAEVGQACRPASTPEGGFDESEVVVETGSTDCASGACLVYRLAGDPNDTCGASSEDAACNPRPNTPLKASDEEVAKRVYCSCRCDAPEGDPGELCACKRGFSCVPAVLDAPPGIRGSYCVKDGTFSSSG